MTSPITIPAALGLALFTAGYFLPLVKSLSAARKISWTAAILATVTTVVITGHVSSLTSMLCIVAILLISMKVIVFNETYRGKPGLTFAQWTAFALGWFGMRPRLFESLPGDPIPASKIFRKGVIGVVAGIIVLHISILLELTVFDWISDALILVGLSLVLHFGLLNIWTAGWRLAGVNVEELFRSPHQSRSLKEFWGRRWNVAFSEMTALIAFRPLKRKYGKLPSLIVAFLMSGLLHEIAISVPIRDAYGLPLCYFIIHALLMVLEASVNTIKGIVSHAVYSRIWVWLSIIAPLPLLFPRAFIVEVLPIRDMIVLFH